MTRATGIVEEYGGPENYHQRQGQYFWAIDRMRDLGLEVGDLVVDVGAGMCDLDFTLRNRGWFGRYVPVDGDIDPAIDLEVWEPTYAADFFVCLDTVEHLHDWRGLVERMMKHARKGILVSTADADTVDVLGMHPTHVVELRIQDLQMLGMSVTSDLIGEYRQLHAFWSPAWAA